MLAEIRRQSIMEIVQRQGFASLDQLSSALDVSESTVRRDLAVLEKTGKARRTHGGVFYTGSQPHVSHFLQNQSRSTARKRAIARAAAARVQDGDTLILDGGSTAFELAQCLVGRNLQVVTNSLPVVNLLSQTDATDVIVLGGFVHSRTGVVLGPYAVQMLEHIHCRWAFLGVAGLDGESLFNSNQLLVETERAMIQSADTVCVLADSSKFGQKGMTWLCGWEGIDQVVVDSELAAEWKTQLQDRTELVIGSITDADRESRTLET